jgi:ribosomal protein L11 methylase PrmA
MLKTLRRWIERLEPSGERRTIWSDYAKKNSYSSEEALAKRDFIDSFVRTVRPKKLWDVGCNTGDYSCTALDAGAELVVGFDADHGALDCAVQRARREHRNFLPLYLDVANPAPSQGWAQLERRGLRERADACAVMALAVIHHLAIGRNIPLPSVIAWLVQLAPQGVIEFVPKTDPMIQNLLQLREDIFDNYHESVFLQTLQESAEIVASIVVSASGRRLFWYRKR